MIEVTGKAQQQAWADGTLPAVESVRPGLWSIPVPIPISPLRYVLVYAFELTDGVAIVDAGWDTSEAWDALVAGLRVAGCEPSDVRAVLVTHIHPDHYGLAGRVREASGAWVGLHRADAALLDERYRTPEQLIDRMKWLLEECGVPDPVASDLSQASMPIRQFVAFSDPDVLLEDGDRPELGGWDLQAVWTPGHSPGHLCFYERRLRLLLSGDHVLPRISPNISIHAQQQGNPLATYIESLVDVDRLDVDEVLPAHEYRFRGLQSRTAALRAHHRARLDEIAALLGAVPDATCWELASQLSWSRPWSQIGGFPKRLAVGETLAHLVLLESEGRVAHQSGRPARWAARYSG